VTPEIRQRSKEQCRKLFRNAKENSNDDQNAEDAVDPGK
jgi:hypothetical protein